MQEKKFRPRLLKLGRMADFRLGQCLVSFSLSVVRGYHVYRTPVLGELGNPEDRYAVLKSSDTL